MTTHGSLCGRVVLAALTLLAAAAVEAVDLTLVASNAVCRYQVPASAADGTNWTAVAFDDAAWDEGRSGLGYETSSGYQTLFGATVPPGTVTFYVRYPFDVPAATNYASLTLRVKYDDGFVAYLNGAEVARANAPATPAYNSAATASHADNLAVIYQDFDITPYASKITSGSNVLALHALNESGGSSDMLLLPELVAVLPDPVVTTNVYINEFMAVNDSTRRNSLGKYEDWVELYNPFATNVSLRGWYLTDKATTPTKWQFPNHAAATVPAKGYLLVWTDSLAVSVTNSELHASFSLSGGGEYLGLVKPDGVTVASEFAPVFPAQYGDISYGLGAAGESRYFATPTPGAVNAFAGASNEVAGLKFSPKRGVYTNVLPQVSASADTAGAEIRYTTDFTPPTASSALYAAPLDLSGTTVFRAAAYKSGFAPSEVDTHSYISADDVMRQPALPAVFPTNLWITGGSTNVPDYAMNQTVVSAYGIGLTNALKALPTLSLVTTISNLFDAATGIYTHPQSLGTNWERAASAEWIDPDNDSRFQIGCGLQIQGGAFRGFNLSMKKSFSLQFRASYGETKLDEDLFEDDPVKSFDDLVLRAGANDAWNKWGHQKTQYIVDEFMRGRCRAMGIWAPHGRFIHVYLNGLYWGIYNVTEKVSSELAAETYGGRDDTWDVRSQDAALDGTYAAWNAMVSLLSTNAVSNDIYQRVQGQNADGTRNPAYPVYLDVQNYIDYLVANYWSANVDWPGNNWRAFRDRIDSVSTGYKFAMWDCEASLGVWGDLTADQTGLATGVAVMQSRLLLNAEYRLRFADRIQKHMFNGGSLTPEVTVPEYRELADSLEPALVAESARWGDQDGNATHTVDQWRAQRDYVLNTFLPQRGSYALQYFRNRGLYPTNGAPVFAQFGSSFSNSLSLTMSASSPIYYTTDGSDPRQYGTGAAVGILYTNGVTLTRTAQVKARARTAGGEWSALTEAVFTREEPSGLRVTELMYHPRAAAAGDSEALDGEDEFIELQNAGDAPVGLAGLKFTQGVTFDFASCPVQTLNPGEYLLVVKSVAAFTNRYPSVSAAKIAGAFAFPSTSLDDAGERVVLEDALGRAVVDLTYNDRWLIATDGAGHSLVPVAGVAQSDGELDYPGHWRASVYIGGSPGEAEPAALARSLVLNEILAHTDVEAPPYDSNDGIELYNASASPLALGEGWYLSDDADALTKWAIPATNALAALGWRYFDEMHDFHSPITNGFGLNKAGDQVFLSYLPAAGPGRVVDALAFEGEENGVPLVRFPDGADAWYHGVQTPGASNRLADADVRISEVMYHPKPTAANPEDNENDEYVELHNPTAHAVTLMDVAGGAGAWRIAGGIDYDFPDGTALAAGEHVVVVSFDPAADAEALGEFLAAYGMTNGQARLFGPFSGQLNNKTDTVRLERPLAPDLGSDQVSWHVVDQVTYYDAEPWLAAADGTGLALERLPGQNSGDSASSWTTGLGATPGRLAAKIAISAPAAGAGYLTPCAIAVAAEVDQTFIVGAVHQVVFAVDGVDAATDASAPYAASVMLSAAEGERRITARLTDDEGTSTSAAVTVVTYTNVPAFSAGSSQAINLTVTDSVDLRATVELLAGMTNPVNYAWSCPAGGAVAIANPTASDASATFSAPGVYEMMLTLYYGQLVTNRFVTVTVLATNTLNRIPYREGFELFEPGMSMVGVGGWHGAHAGLASVQTNRFGAGDGGQPLSGAHERGMLFAGSVTNVFAPEPAVTNVCIDMLVGFQIGVGAENPTALDSDVQFAFWVTEGRSLLVWHGVPGGTNRWTELQGVSVPSNRFSRLTLMADYGAKQGNSYNFRLWVDRQPVTQPALWYATASTNHSFFSSVELSGEGQIDDLVVDSYNSMLYRRITAAAGAHGRVAPGGDVYVPVGGSTNIAVLPDAFYSVSSVRVDGQQAGPVTSYAFTNVWDEHALAAEFAASLTSGGVPELWLHALNPLWVDDFETHAQGDLDGDGAKNGDEYVAGTDATNSLSVFRVAIASSNGQSVVSFPTAPYSGEAYGLSGVRRYALEAATALPAGPWQDVGGYSGVLGAGQRVSYTNEFAEPVRFFRGRVWLDQ